MTRLKCPGFCSMFKGIRCNLRCDYHLQRCSGKEWSVPRRAKSDQDANKIRMASTKGLNKQGGLLLPQNAA
jgi:hypothetical protein